APFNCPSQTPRTISGNESAPAQTFTRAMVLKASNPESAPVCAPFNAPKKTNPEPTASGVASRGAAKTFFARYGAVRITSAVIRPPEIEAADTERARIRPALAGSFWRNSATYLVAVKPKPRPARTPNIPAVLWIIP